MEGSADMVTIEAQTAPLLVVQRPRPEGPTLCQPALALAMRTPFETKSLATGLPYS